MFSSNNGFNLFKNWQKLATSFLYCYLVSALMIICAGYISNNKNQRRQLELASIWYDNHPGYPESKKLIESFINEIQVGMNDISLGFTDDISEELIETQIRFFEEQNQYLIPFKVVQRDRTFVNFQKATPVYSEKRKQQQEQEASLNNYESKVFANLIMELKNGLYNGYLQEINSQQAQDNFLKYSEAVIRYFTSENSNYSKNYPYLKAESIYLANRNGAMAWYPSQALQISLNDFIERPWGRAVWEESFRSDYKKFNDNSGLTSPYTDINDKGQPILVRTLWYKFRDENIDYVLCLDLLFDSSSQLDQESNLLAQYASAGLLIQPTNNTWLDFLIQSLIGASLIFSLYEFNLKNTLSKLFTSKPDEFLKVKLQRISKYYATRNDGNEIKLTVQGETKEVNESTRSREAGWSFNISNININTQSRQANTRQSELTYRYELSQTYNLDISQSKHRCIETWKVVLESQSDKTEDIGFFVAKWNRTNSTNITDELDIKSIHWEKKYEDDLESIKAQLCDHLLISEKPEFLAVLDPNYKKKENIPLYLSQIYLIKDTLDKSSYLKQRKMIFPEIKTVTRLYSLGTVKAIINLEFLKSLIELNQLSDFLNVPVYERFFIENREAEFKDFYQSLDNQSQSIFRNTSAFKIMVYQRDVNNIIASKDDFCIVEINGKPSIVAYTFTDDQYPNAGWISWREVDVQFYAELYKTQKDKGHRIESVDNYLKNYSL
ncbi:MAG: hypothetical protein F6K58_27720 [Symploca sp. SIO2E9]|nr:hypothetical protein [Symploca sp. SIO2E9]